MPQSIPGSASHQTCYKPYWTVALITLVIAINYIDRYILSILIEPIRLELKLTDLQVGLLTGAGFALLYSTVAIPVARLAERYNRVVILVVAVLVWSAATGLSGLASGFPALLLARMMVGCGEAGALAPALSMISDLFPMERRSTAMSIVGLGAPAGSMIAPLVGGWLTAVAGWRAAFVSLGLAGIPLAVVIAGRMREPQRGLSDGAAEVPKPLPVGMAVRRLYKRRTFSLLTIALILMAVGEYSMILWMPSMFYRSFGTTVAELGAQIALYQGLPFLIGTYLGGFAADRMGNRDPRWIVWVPMIGAFLTAPALFGLCTIKSQSLAFILLMLPSLVNGLYIGPCYALMQSLAAVHSRATAVAAMVFCVNLIGAGLGPFLLGVLSERLAAHWGPQSLRYAFLSLIPVYLCTAGVFASMSRRLKVDLENARQDSLGLLST